MLRAEVSLPIFYSRTHLRIMIILCHKLALLDPDSSHHTYCMTDPKPNYISFSGQSSINIIIRSKNVIIKIQSSLTRHFPRCHFDWKSDIVIREKLDKNLEANCSTFIERKKVDDQIEIHSIFSTFKITQNVFRKNTTIYQSCM